jgi:hypothetical protein
MTGSDGVRAQAHGVVQKGFELDFGVAQDIRVGRAPGLVFTQKLGKYAVFVVSGKIDVLDLDTQHVGHGGGVYKIFVGGAVARCAGVAVGTGWLVVVFPVFPEYTKDFMALLAQQIGRHSRVHATA